MSEGSGDCASNYTFNDSTTFLHKIGNAQDFWWAQCYKRDVHTLTDKVLATIPSTMPSVNGSKCLSGLLINSGFNL